MNDADLDLSYGAVCRALSDVGEARAPLFLATLCLALLSQRERAEDVLPLVEQARRSSLDGE